MWVKWIKYDAQRKMFRIHELVIGWRASGPPRLVGLESS